MSLHSLPSGPTPSPGLLPVLFAGLLLGLLPLAPPVLAETPLRIAVAANFKPTLLALTDAFTEDTGIPVRVSSASTGVLSTQVRHGAPFDLFFAADRVSADAAAGQRAAFCYAAGRLALLGGELADLARPDLSLAIANPVTAPYGRAALEVLARDAFAEAAGRDLVRGNNAAQAVQFWHAGAVDLALAPLALAPPGAARVPAAWHAPIEQYAVALTDRAEVQRYLAWLGSDTVRTRILDAGYEPCP